MGGKATHLLSNNGLGVETRKMWCSCIPEITANTSTKFWAPHQLVFSHSHTQFILSLVSSLPSSLPLSPSSPHPHSHIHLLRCSWRASNPRPWPYTVQSTSCPNVDNTPQAKKGQGKGVHTREIWYQQPGEQWRSQRACSGERRQWYKVTENTAVTSTQYIELTMKNSQFTRSIRA